MTHGKTEIIEVDKTHRILIQKLFKKGSWVWEVLPQQRFLFLFWGSSSWEEGGSYSFFVKNYWSFETALAEAHRLRDNFLDL